MQKSLFLVICFQMAIVTALAQSFTLSTYKPNGDGKTDDTPAFKRLFADVKKAKGGTVTIPAGTYYLSGVDSIQIPSNTVVMAYGAQFYLPKQLGDKARIVLFSGTDVEHFSWFGGYFQGYCFDHRSPPNTWEPNVNTRVFVIRTSPQGRTDQLLFRDISSEKIAGAVVTVLGVHKDSQHREVLNFATNVTVENCTFLNTGKFMWDYGMLWQIIVFPEMYTAADQAMARRYFRNDLIREGVQLKAGQDKVFLNNQTRTIPVSSSDAPQQALCFFGKNLPGNLVRGKQYFVVESGPDYLKISGQPGGKPIRFDQNVEERISLIYNLHEAYAYLYAPVGAGPGKGCIDLMGCRNTRVQGCKISALGDAMHIHSSQNNLFANNQILGARMGAFFLAEYCKNSTITGNTVDGTNGSRVISIERSNEDVTVIGNTFRGGGRGSWINQPKNLIIQGNIFINNTTKCERDPWRGRRSFKTGDWESYSEMYFTTYEPNGRYGPVILRDNVFVTGPEAKGVIELFPHGSDLLIEGNIFKGGNTTILQGEDTDLTLTNNRGGTLQRVQQTTMTH
ncbi:hypothetical protein BN8_03440 [Fibrisoma limi BUZ 3]|uniref:Periplasmic copper-binding protein NosD beta helix domain-containing protein n=1 Tax=Fibrisoma limi BUZ 3 TaxID=1185876 RepID=I2GK57_9BACT|nr:right-handed parallel beta-helix repeat-containing protein [Fibrisoma limi]CCH54282.1 hypothetical protein BN8_03440 [Fibrisoma limi BUZ 3]